MAPLSPHPIARALDPIDVIAAWRRRGPVVALESALPSAAHGEQTIVAGCPLALFTWQRGRAAIAPLRAGVHLPSVDVLSAAPSPFHALQQCVRGLGVLASPAGAPPVGAFGWFGYEAMASREVPRLAPYPDAWFLLTDTVVHWPRPGASPTLWSCNAALARELQSELHGSRPRLAGLDGVVAEWVVSESAPPRRVVTDADLIAPGDVTEADYSALFMRARESLAAGDSYQLCLTYPFVRELPADPLALYAVLRRENPAPFAAFVTTPSSAVASSPEFALVSSSPERFLRVDEHGHVEARPMKGTASKPPDAEARALASRALTASEKMLAENLMIADLLRNDLGRVCRLGSVRASQVPLVEEHPTLLQLVSVIEGDLEAGRDVADLLVSAFPPGSMTGAPKPRSIELLRALERGPRGPYSGALGYIAADGRADLSVVIRTVLCAGGLARVNVGGGLVWDSQAALELAESRAKAAPLLRALAACGARPTGRAIP